MTADPYIKQAASQLHNAAATVQDEIRTIQMETYGAQKSLNSEAVGAQNEQTRLRVEMGATSDSNHKTELEGRLRTLSQAAKDKQNEISKRGTDAANVVQEKTGLANQLQSIASKLESMKD